MRNVNIPAILNQVSTSANSNLIDGQLLVYGSVQAIATGTLAGTLKLQVSNDQCPTGNLASKFVPTNWTDLASANVGITGTPGTFLIPKTDLCYRFIRAVFVTSGGSGTLTAEFNGIGF